jgi:Methyltransferase domain
MSTANPDPLQFSCRLCGEALRERAWGGGECTACGSVSVRSVPTPDELAAFYANYGERYTGGGGSQGRNQIRYAQRYLARVRSSSRGGRLIDVGSANSPFPALAARHGFDVTVMDYACPRGLPDDVAFLEGHLDDLDVLARHGAAFDVVCAWAVIEHLPRPVVGAEVLAGLCAPGARLHLSTPEIGTFITDRASGRSPWFYPPEHLHLQSPAAVQTIFEDLGFTLIHQGRLELNGWRHAARYGLGWLEACAGAAFKRVHGAAWERMRDTRQQHFAGISCFEFERPWA